MPDFISPAFPEAQEGASTQAEPPSGLPGVPPSTAPLGATRLNTPPPLPRGPWSAGEVQGAGSPGRRMLHNQRKSTGAVEEREEEQREEVMALPSQQQNPLSGRKVAVTRDPDLSLQGKKVPPCRPGGWALLLLRRPRPILMAHSGWSCQGRGWSLMWGHRGRSSKSCGFGDKGVAGLDLGEIPAGC